MGAKYMPPLKQTKTIDLETIKQKIRNNIKLNDMDLELLEKSSAQDIKIIESILLQKQIEMKEDITIDSGKVLAALRSEERRVGKEC